MERERPHASAAPSPTATASRSGEGGEERRKDLPPRHAAVADVLTQLATTARSFLFYDSHNDAIHGFLTRLLSGFGSLLEAEPRVEIQVQPFELRFEDRPVYLNHDREQSLAFRLYRDGVRGLTFRRGFAWEELSRLLEVLSIRYAGVHQHEDDMVTLLWKANFEHLDVAAVEGFAPEEDDEAEPDGGDDAEAAGFVLPDDLPTPSLPSPIPPLWVDVSETARAALCAEASSGALPYDCLALLRLIRRSLEHGDALPFAEVAHLFVEVRDFLLSDEHLDSLLRFATLLAEMAETARDATGREALGGLLSSCADRRAVAALLHSVPAGAGELKPQLVALLDRTRPDPLGTVVDALAGERNPSGRAVGRALIAHYGEGRVDRLQEAFEAAEAHLAADLLDVVAEIGGGAVEPWVARQICHAAPAVQDAALRRLKRMRYNGPLGRLLIDAFRQAEPCRRTLILELMAGSRDLRLVEPLVQFVEQAGQRLGPAEAEEIGRTLGRLGGAAGLPRWSAWLQPSGVLRKVIHASEAVQIAAAAALAEVPGPEAARALRRAAATASPGAHEWVGRALSRQTRSSREAS